MGNALSEDEVAGRLLGFIRERFLAGDERRELDEDTPLLEWRVLDSLNTAVLISYIREEFGTPVPIEKLTAATFKNVRSISSMLCSTMAQAG
ncbi:MAG TPA: acyl carrier protein [Micromonosporaceae bacterium]|nr:acyl carrier protein [Micromonosporaceae bacterium]